MLAYFIIGFTLVGNVFRTDTEEPLQAHVYVLDLDQVYVCDSAGLLIIPQLSAGTYTIIISHVGYKEETLSVKTPALDTISIEIGLEVSAISVEPVEATGERIVAPGEQVLQTAEMQVMPGAEQNVFRALQMMPGISTASDYLGLFYVRGGELYENKVFLDNIEILAPYHYFGVGSAFNAGLVEDFEFFLGNIPVRYGDVVSSVLLLRSKEISQKQGGSVSLDLVEANLNYSLPISNEISASLAVKRNYLDFLLRRMGIIEGVMLPYFFDAQGKVNFRTHIGDFFIGGLYSREGTDIQTSIMDDTIDLQLDGGANTMWFGWQFEATDRLSYQAYASYADFQRHMFGRGPAVADTAFEDYTSFKYGVRAHSEYDAGFATLSLGGGFGRYGITHAGAKIEDIFYKIGALYYSLEVDTNDHYGFLYAVQRFPVFQNFECEFGERIDWFPVIRKPTFSPRVRLVYHKNPSIYLTYGYLFQKPPFEYPVQDYKPLQARSMSLGIEYLVLPALSGRIELYRKKYTNLIQRQSSELLDNDGHGQASGIEISLRRYHVGTIFGMISYAFSFSERTTPYDAEPVTMDVHRPHILNFFLGNRLPAGFNVGVQFQIASGMTYRPVIGREGDWYYWHPIYAPEKERLPYYQRLDIHVGKNFAIWNIRGEFYVTVLNILGRKNIQGYLYDWEYTARKAIYMMPRVPMFGLRMEF